MWPPCRTDASKEKEPQDSSPAVKFDVDPQQLGFFMAQVWTYMQEYGPERATEDSKVRYGSTL